MAFFFNGTEVTQVFFNGTELAKLVFNGVEVFASTATSWTYLGTTNPTFNNTATYQDGFFCADSGTVGTWLTSNYPPSNYSVGIVFRVTVLTGLGGSCGYMYFEATA